jgi:hypothetical protein
VHALFEMHATDEDNIEKHIRYLEKCWQTIEQFNLKKLKIHEDLFMGILLTSLPSSWDDFIHPFMSKQSSDREEPLNHDDHTDVTLDDLIGHLIDEAHHHKRKVEMKNNQALLAQSSSNKLNLQSRIGDQSDSQKSSKRCTNCKHYRHVKDDCWFLKLPCEKCSKYGHTANVCCNQHINYHQGYSSSQPKRYTNNNPQGKPKGPKKPHIEGQMHAVVEKVTLVATVAEINPIDRDNKYCVDYEDSANEDTVLFYDWLTDSGMTSHICNNCDSFETYCSLPNSVVQGIRNVTAKVKGHGTVKLCSHVDDKSYMLILQDVLHMPMSQYNLLSLGKWDKSCGNFSVDHSRLSLVK